MRVGVDLLRTTRDLEVAAARWQTVQLMLKVVLTEWIEKRPAIMPEVEAFLGADRV